MSETTRGRLIGAGTGPGDPGLVTVKAMEAIRDADVVAYFCRKGGTGRGRDAVAAHIPASAELLPMVYPLTVEVEHTETAYLTAIEDFFDTCAEAIAARLDAGRDVVVLSEGDPLFYGSYMHLHVRLAPRYAAEIIPGVTAMSGCWSMVGLPLVRRDESLVVLPGTLDEPTLEARLAAAEGAVIMKVGRNLPKIRRALERIGRLDRAVYVERGTMSDGRAERLADRDDAPAPYFSLVLVPHGEARPWATAV